MNTNAQIESENKYMELYGEDFNIHENIQLIKL